MTAPPESVAPVFSAVVEFTPESAARSPSPALPGLTLARPPPTRLRAGPGSGR